MPFDLNDLPPPPPPGHLVERVEVTDDFKRIYTLPRREWEKDPRLPEVTARLTRALRTPTGTMTLRPAQAAALWEVATLGGGFIPALPGSGKTLLSLLCAAVLRKRHPTRFTRNMILVPAAGGMLQKTRDEALEDYAPHWTFPAQTILSYEKISQEQLEKGSPSIVERYRPELVVCDEAGACAHTDTALWRTLHAYARKYPDTGWVFMDGTFADSSLDEYWHLIRLALGPDRAPVPHHYHEKNAWCGALDVRPRTPVHPGALLKLSPLPASLELDPDVSDQTRARVAYRLRLTHTPGVIATGAADVPDVPLAIYPRTTQLPQSIATVLETMRAKRVTPSGERIKYSIELWRHAQELACGFYSVWDPPAPPEWADARYALGSFVSETLEHSRTLFKPSAVIRAIDSGHLPEGVSRLQAWREIRDTFRPNPVPIWIDDRPLHQAAEWLREHPDHGLVWVAHRPAGQRLSELSGVPYFGPKGLPTDLTRHPKIRVDKWKRSAIVSLAACWKGFNLQKYHWENLYLTVPTKAKRWEQSLARTHRSGQTHPVTCEVWIACQEHEDALSYAYSRAQYVQETFDQPQKLLYADNHLPARIVERAGVYRDEEQEQEEDEDGETDQDP